MGWARDTEEGEGMQAGFWLGSQKEDPGVERRIILNMDDK